MPFFVAALQLNGTSQSLRGFTKEFHVANGSAPPKDDSKDILAYIVMAYIVMAYTVMA